MISMEQPAATNDLLISFLREAVTETPLDHLRSLS
jgi:hypothetical protein